jgi:hypothetical protein
MSLFRVAALLIMCAIALSVTPQNSATKQAAKPDDIPKSIAESVSGTLQFAEGNFLGLAETMPEDKVSYVPQSASSMASGASGNKSSTSPALSSPSSTSLKARNRPTTAKREGTIQRNQKPS